MHPLLTQNCLSNILLHDQELCINQIESFNSFIDTKNAGINHILEKFFSIQNVIPLKEEYRRDDGRIVKSTRINLTFEDVQLEQTQTKVDQIQRALEQKDLSVIEDASLPNNARRTGKSLILKVYSNIKMVITQHGTADALGAALDTDTKFLERQEIAQIPLMVKSERCITSQLTKQQMVALKEDPLDSGGYFILKGSEWSIDSTESIKFNELQAIYDPSKHQVRAFIMSKPGDTFENSIQTNIQYNEKTHRLVVIINIERFKEIEIPFFMIFKLFGIMNDKSILEMICQKKIEDNNAENNYIQTLIQNAIRVDYTYFEGIQEYKTHDQFVNKLVSMLQDERVKNKSKLADYLVFDSVGAMKSLHQNMFPHIGTTELNAVVKMRYFGQIIRKIILMFKNKSFVDINAYQDKRIHSTGQNFAKSFKKQFNNHVIGALKKELIMILQKQPFFKQNEFQQTVMQILKKSSQEKSLQKQIVTSQGVDPTGKQNMQQKPQAKNTLQSQLIVRKNPLATVAQMRQINNSKQSQDKGSKKKIEERAIQPQFFGFICLVQAVETSEKAGKLKTFGALTRITSAILSDIIYKQARELIGDKLVPLLDIECSDVSYKYANFFINGFWLNYIDRSEVNATAVLLRQFRRQNPQKWKFITIFIDRYNDLYIYSDYGRMLSPFVIVHRKASGEPYINITPELQQKLLAGNTNTMELLENQVIEYLSIEEAQNCLVAESFDAFYVQAAKRKDQTVEQIYNFSHVMIPIAMFGLVALHSPFMNFQQTQRVTMFTNQARQACGLGSLSYPFRVDKQLFVQYYVGQPLVRTIATDLFPPNGQNVVIAYTVADGSNQDDSIIFNKDSADRGLFRCVQFTYEESQSNYHEYIENIDEGKLKGGVVQRGQWVFKNDVLVAKKQNVRTGEQQIDTSLVYRKDEPAYVVDVFKYQNEKGSNYHKIMLMTLRQLAKGDKMSARSGCKSVISVLKPASEMPYMSNGTVPDIIFNVHSLIKRMLCSQIYEGAMARISAKTGRAYDATVFNPFDPAIAEDLMKKVGIMHGGTEFLYHPVTGEMIKSRVYTCPNFYQRLQRFAIASQYCVADGAKDPYTRQAISGRKQQGGAKLGEMESDGLYSHGSLNTWEEKLYSHSDGFQMYYCKICGRQATYNPGTGKKRRYTCDGCDGQTDIVQVNTTWMSNVFNHQLNAMNVDVTYGFEKPRKEISIEKARELGLRI